MPIAATSNSHPKYFVRFDLHKLWGPIARKGPPSPDEPVFIKVQRTFADLHGELKKSNSFDLDEIEENEMQYIIGDVALRGEETYQFEGQNKLVSDLQIGFQQKEAPGLPEVSIYDSALKRSANNSPELVTKPLPVKDEQTVYYEAFIAKLRAYFKKKGVEDKAQQDRIFYALFQRLGGWIFEIPKSHLVLLTDILSQHPSLQNLFVCCADTPAPILSLQLSHNNAGDVFITYRCHFEYGEKFTNKERRELGYLETCLLIPKNPNEEICLVKAEFTASDEEIGKQIVAVRDKFEEHAPLVAEPIIKRPNLSRVATVKAHLTPATRTSTEAYGYVPLWKRAANWAWKNRWPLLTGAAAVVCACVGVALCFTAIGSPLGVFLTTIGVEFVVSEAVMTVLTATAMAAAGAVVMGGFGAASYLSSNADKKREPSPIKELTRDYVFCFNPLIDQEPHDTRRAELARAELNGLDDADLSPVATPLLRAKKQADIHTTPGAQDDYQEEEASEPSAARVVA